MTLCVRVKSVYLKHTVQNKTTQITRKTKQYKTKQKQNDKQLIKINDDLK